MSEQFVRTQHAQTYRLALILTKNPRDAEEVTQEAFLQTLARHRGAPDDELVNWLRRTVSNLAIMRLRKHRQKQQILADDLLPRFFESGRLEKKPSDWSAQADKDAPALAGTIHTAIEQLPEKYRWILLLRDVEGVDIATIAVILGMSKEAVKSILHRSRMFVREALNHHYEDKAA